jgi:Xaa-Pro aminopeptidase
VTRVAALGERLDAPLLVTNLVNVAYLVGFESSNAALLVRPGGETTLYTDFRYAEQARTVADVDVVMTKRSLLADVGERLSGRVQFEADVLPYSEWERLAAGGAELVPTSGIVAELRAVKDDEELAAIGRAARAADRALEALTAETWVGRTERQVAWRLLELSHAHGADDRAFESIVASGPRGALPHGRPTDNVIERNTLVTVDWGAQVNGYYSDCTRTFSTGGVLPDRLRAAYDTTLAAQRKAMAEIKPGMSGVDADRIARAVIEEAELGEFFGHGLGHGVGLDVHEAPRLSRESPDTLAVGHVVTVEPGIYLPGLGGCRIEDLAVVREHGLESLTSFPKELIEVS